MAIYYNGHLQATKGGGGSSGGGGIDYSTTEQNTGLKWIDGKPIYQKTFNITPNSYADISTLNIDSVVSADGMVKLHGNYWDQLNIYAGSNYNAQFEIAVPDGRITTTVGSNWTADAIYITLLYTKTTDTI